MRAVFLVGVNHQYQVGPGGDPPVEASEEDFSKFKEFLRSVIKCHKILGIAEEMSRCALRIQRQRADSVPYQLAAERQLPHRYCDPDQKTQDALNITRSTPRKRQQYWINELIAFNTFPVLFILGADEVESFQRLLREAAFQPFVVARNWQPDKPR